MTFDNWICNLSELGFWFLCTSVFVVVVSFWDLGLNDAGLLFNFVSFWLLVFEVVLICCNGWVLVLWFPGDLCLLPFAC